MAEALAAQIDPVRYGVVAIYVFGSTKNATAGPESDIDILIHFRGTESQRLELTTWLQGWSVCLSEINYLLTGHQTNGLLDIHIITDLDIRNRTSFAVKIGAVTDAARPLPGLFNPQSEIHNPKSQISSLVASSGLSRSTRISASSGPSCAADNM